MATKQIEKRKDWTRIVVSMDAAIAAKLRAYAKSERLTITGACEKLLEVGLAKLAQG